MNHIKHNLRLRIVKILMAVLATIPFAACWYLYYADSILRPFYNKGNWLMIVLFLIVYIMFVKIYDAFQVSTHRISYMVYSQTLSVLLADGIMFVVIWLLKRSFPNALPGVIALAAQFLLIVIWSIGAHNWYFKAFPPKKSAIVYDKQYAIERLIHQYDLTKKFEICQIVKATECAKNLDRLNSMETVFISGVPSHDRNVILKHCVSQGITVYVLPRIGDIILSGARRMHMFHLPMLRVDRAMNNPENVFVKRCMDILFATIALIVVSPIMLIAAIAIKAYDGGPVLYRQTRLTRDGKEFQIIKFRSMRVDAEKDGVARLSTGDKDDRITPVGRIVRKLRIDELPQLINIIGGSMSIVGPRPERPEIAAQYEKALPEFRLRLQVKAGLTGYAQVYGKYNTSPYDKLQMDLMYIANANVLEDLRIILATLKVLFLSESTDGIDEGQTTAVKETVEENLVGAGKR